jgi:hypothetical protein
MSLEPKHKMLPIMVGPSSRRVIDNGNFGNYGFHLFDDLFQVLRHIVVIKGLTALYAFGTGDIFNDDDASRESNDMRRAAVL